MSEEIKEILDKLRSNDYYEKEYQKSVYYERDLKKLEDYIINLQDLQEEIERLNKQIEEYQKALDETASEKINLENIIKEVREYLDIDESIRKNCKRYDVNGIAILEILDKGE